ncbi:MAG TPA: hypothetical protein LFW12_00440, partial [Rickettsia endosymbiont of Sericostoma sp. HW-2014]|nr:hypothetical protein [Rickettsia endosymbiont of Sericostoma sp. HW-2014]
MSYCKEIIGRIYNDLIKGLVKSLEKFLLKLQKFAQKSRRKNRSSTFRYAVYSMFSFLLKLTPMRH